MAVIEFENVTLGRRVLDDVTLAVPEGGVLAICGPQEAGKSALIRVLTGLEAHTEGSILVDGEKIDRKNPRARDVSAMLAPVENYPHLTVRENLAFAARLRKGQSGVAEVVADVADLLGLTHLLKVKPARLTDAERRLVALGRALVRDAAVYAFDEPLDGLDPRTRSMIRARVLTWQRDHGRTTIWATGDVGEALSVGDEVAVMHQGRVHQVDTPHDLYEFPIDVFVAAFLGFPPMNMLPGRVEGDVLRLPFVGLPLADSLAEQVGDSGILLAGIRPADCVEATARRAGGDEAIEFTAVVDEVEWHGSERLAYLGFDLDEDVVARLEALEDILEFDLFATHLVARVDGASLTRAGHALRVAIDPSRLHIFDAETGVNLSLLAGEAEEASGDPAEPAASLLHPAGVPTAGQIAADAEEPDEPGEPDESGESDDR